MTKECFCTWKCLSCVIYADDNVILTESANDSQFASNSIYGKLKLTVYISKTKIDVVSKGRQSKYVFTYNGLLVK